MKDTFKTLINGVKFWAENMLKKSVADWNQNDETAPNYVKNRPFYVTMRQLTFAENQTIELGKDGTFYSNYWDNLSWTWMPNFSVGQEYTVIWNGESYTTICTTEGVLGNEKLIASSGTDTGEVFYLSKSIIGGTFEGEVTITILSAEEVEEVHQLDRKYLPDSIAVLRAEINSSENYLRLYMNDELLGDVPWDEYVSLESSVFHQICDMVGDGKLIGFLREKNSTSELTYNAILTCSKHSHLIHMNVFPESGGTRYIQIARESSE